MLRRCGRLASVAFLGCLMLSAQAAPRDVTGRVFESISKRGIENLEVRLTPPRAANAAIRVTSSDQNGAFRFARVQPGDYLLEISQGPNLLYRAQIDAATQGNIDVPLQQR